MAATTSSETKTDKFCKNFDCQEQTFEYKIWIKFEYISLLFVVLTVLIFIF